MVVFLIDAAAKSLLLFTITTIVCATLRKASAATRHFLWVVALGMAILMPAFNLVLPKAYALPNWAQKTHTSPIVQIDEYALPMRADRAAASAETIKVQWPRLLQDKIDATVPTVTEMPPSKSETNSTIPRRRDATWNESSTGIVIWACGTLLMLLPLAFGNWASVRLGKAFPPITSGYLFDATLVIASELRTKPPCLHIGAAGAMPMVWGFLRGHLLLPDDAKSWDANRLRAVLLHELAHLRRLDPLTMVVGQLARAAYWFNPLAWWAIRQIRIEREGACDDYVLRHNVKSSDYAAILLELTANLCPHRGPSFALSMANSTRIDGRLRTILDVHQNRNVVSKGTVYATLLLATLTTISLSIVRAADEKPVDSKKSDVNKINGNKTNVASDLSNGLPTVEEIQNGYRQNFAGLFPLGVIYRVSEVEGIGDIEYDRQYLERAKQSSPFGVDFAYSSISINGHELSPEEISEIKIKLEQERQSKLFDSLQFKIDGREATEEELAAMKTMWRNQRQRLPLRIAGLEGKLQDEVVNQRLTVPHEKLHYFWTDGSSMHYRVNEGERVDLDKPRSALFPGPVSPAEGLKSRFREIVVASWSNANDPPMRLWFGDFGGPLHGAIGNHGVDEFLAVCPFPPVGFVRTEWADEQSWRHDFDGFMLKPPSRLQVVANSDLNGRSVIIVDGFLSDSNKDGSRERTRLWVDPNQGFLPLRTECTYLDVKGNEQREPKLVIEIIEARKVANGYYPTRVKRQEYRYIEDRAKKVVGSTSEQRGRAASQSFQRLPGRTKTWDVVELLPFEQIEPGAIALEFPVGAFYENGVDNCYYHAGDSTKFYSPFPLVPTVKLPGAVAPPWEIAGWTDGETRQIEDFKGKVVVLYVWDSTATEFEPFLRIWKNLLAKHSDQNVVMLGVHPAGTSLDEIREYQKKHDWKAITGVDKGADQGDGATLRMYTRCISIGLIIIGRDGRVKFNAIEPDGNVVEEVMERAAKKLGIPWPPDEWLPKEKLWEIELAVDEFWFSQKIDEAVNEPMTR